MQMKVFNQYHATFKPYRHEWHHCSKLIARYGIVVVNQNKNNKIHTKDKVVRRGVVTDLGEQK